MSGHLLWRAWLLVLVMCAAPAGAQEWKLVWSDEFNEPGLPDPAKWGYEQGFIRNNEAQYYTAERPENARVEEGCLVIEGRKETYPNAQYDPSATTGPHARKEAHYTAASLTTHGKHAWTFGRFEVRAKLPQGKGMWPAIWMLGTNIDRIGWPACGEIDIMEFVGKEPNHIFGTVHWGNDGTHASKGEKLVTESPFDDFHVYATEWTPQTIDFYFDDTKYFAYDIPQATENGENPFHKPHFLLINLAIGGSWGGAIDDSVLPQKYKIDYVRIYQQPEAAEADSH